MTTALPTQRMLRFAGGVVLSLATAMFLFGVLLDPPAPDLRAMALFLSTTAAVSVGAGLIVVRSGAMRRSPRVSWTLLAGFLLTGALAFFNVWATARLMFASSHDLLLATVLLVFAGGIAMSFGYLIAESVAGRLVRLNRAARSVATGDLDVRVQPEGRDEVAELARAFNRMTEALSGAARRQKELDDERRDLYAWVSHDLRTPLASVRAILEALADGVVDDPDAVERYLRTALRDISSLAELIDDLFTLTRLEAGGLRLDLRPSSLADLVSDTIESFAPQAEAAGVTLAGEVKAEVDTARLDTVHFGRALTNLVRNALEHTPAGGSVEIRAYPGEADAVTVEVVDTGMGIQAADLPHVFDGFFRGDRARPRGAGGAGLGLAIVRGVVAAHGGVVRVESEPGRGSRFSLHLPRAGGRTRAGGSHAARDADPPPTEGRPASARGPVSSPAVIRPVAGSPTPAPASRLRSRKRNPPRCAG